MKTAAAAPMRPVATQPVMVQDREMRNSPMIEERTLINMMSAITGAATKVFITLTPDNVRAVPGRRRTLRHTWIVTGAEFTACLGGLRDESAPRRRLDFNPGADRESQQSKEPRPGKPKDSGSRQQSHQGQSTQTGSPAADHEHTRRGGAGPGARPPGTK
jgi:hypothetical protein